MVNMVQVRAAAVLIAAGFSQTDTAKFLGVSQATISIQLKKDTGGINGMIKGYKEVMKAEVAGVFIKGEA